MGHSARLVLQIDRSSRSARDDCAFSMQPRHRLLAPDAGADAVERAFLFEPRAHGRRRAARRARRTARFRRATSSSVASIDSRRAISSSTSVLLTVSAAGPRWRSRNSLPVDLGLHRDRCPVPSAGGRTPRAAARSPARPAPPARLSRRPASSCSSSWRTWCSASCSAPCCRSSRTRRAARRASRASLTSFAKSSSSGSSSLRRMPLTVDVVVDRRAGQLRHLVVVRDTSTVNDRVSPADRAR